LKKTLLKLKKVQSKKIFGSVAAKNAELLGRDTHTYIILWKKGKISRIMIFKILSKQWIGVCSWSLDADRLQNGD
jgi:hypothetical protein